MNTGRLRFFPPTSAKKERDEELALFRELFKREREKNMNLLESVSTELEPVDGNSVVFKLSGGKKSDHGNPNEKNDYDWLKTPPATPLFQSLEMDIGQGNNLNMIIQKDLPIIPPLKPSRFSEKAESKTISKPPCSPSMASIRSASSSCSKTADLDSYPLSPPRSITTPIATPRFGSQRFAKESNKESSNKPPHSGRFLRRKEEPKLTPKSPVTLSVNSTPSSSRAETPDVNRRPPSIRKAANTQSNKEDPKPVERSINRFTKQTLDAKPPIRQLKPFTSPSSSRPDSPDLKPIKSKSIPKSLDKPVRKTIKELPAKQISESKQKDRTISPLVRSRFPADFPTETPPNLITSVSKSRTNSATRSRPGVSSIVSPEKMKEKKGLKNNGVVIGSSIVERMLNARKSTGSGKISKIKGGL